MNNLVWKQGDGWIQHDPPKGHPCYDEWIKLKEKEKQENETKI